VSRCDVYTSKCTLNFVVACTYEWKWSSRHGEATNASDRLMIQSSFFYCDTCWVNIRSTEFLSQYIRARSIFMNDWGIDCWLLDKCHHVIVTVVLILVIFHQEYKFNLLAYWDMRMINEKRQYVRKIWFSHPSRYFFSWKSFLT